MCTVCFLFDSVLPDLKFLSFSIAILVPVATVVFPLWDSTFGFVRRSFIWPDPFLPFPWLRGPASIPLFIFQLRRTRPFSFSLPIFIHQFWSALFFVPRDFSFVARAPCLDSVLLLCFSPRSCSHSAGRFSLPNCAGFGPGPVVVCCSRRNGSGHFSLQFSFVRSLRSRPHW
jgi:hypothetical protein